MIELVPRTDRGREAKETTPALQGMNASLVRSHSSPQAEDPRGGFRQLNKTGTMRALNPILLLLGFYPTLI